MTSVAAPADTPAVLRSRPVNGDQRRVIRGNRLDERVVAAVALVSGVAAAFSGARPTGTTVIDVVLVAMAVGVVTWAAGSAPWWALALAAAVASTVAVQPVLTLLGSVAFIGGLWIGLRRRDLGELRAVVAALALNVLTRAELEGFFGLSALVGVTVAAVLFVLGIRRRRRGLRRRAWQAVGAGGVVVVLAALGFGVAASGARSGLTDGNRLAREAISQLDQGEFAAAAERFESAAQSFARADRHLGRPWSLPARLVPVLAQNRDAATELGDVAAAASADLATALRQIDPEQLRLVDGRIDLDAIRAVAEALASVRSAMDELQTTLDDVASPWLAGPLQDRLDTLDVDLADNAEGLDTTATAVDLAPQLLGADGPRRYFVAFTTPSEARGLGGFMGNFAVLTATDGQLEMTEFGRTTDLNLGGPDPLARTVTGPDDWLARYGRYGFDNGPGGTTGAVPWSNVTISPHFPSTAQVIAELFPQSGGQRVDGVFAMDPYVIAALLEFTGPIQIPAVSEELTADNVLPFLLTDQYRLGEGTERIDLLEEVAEETTRRVLSGALPNPTELADSLGELARQGRLVGWSADPSEQALFDDVQMNGALPELAGGDGIAITTTNAGGSKIDAFLQRDVTYRATFDEGSGQLTATAEITLTNTAPTSGLPPVVVGNVVGEPVGTNRSLLSVYSAVPVQSVMLDGQPVLWENGREAGWSTATAAVSIPSSSSITVTLELGGNITADGGYTLSTRPQPLVLPETHDLLVTSVDGDELVAEDEVATVPERYEVEAER